MNQHPIIYIVGKYVSLNQGTKSGTFLNQGTPDSGQNPNGNINKDPKTIGSNKARRDKGGDFLEEKGTKNSEKEKEVGRGWVR